MNERNENEGKRGKGTLFLVATPIGNLEDITARALRVLREADLIAAEDTRRTLALLTHFGVKRPLTSYYEQNAREKGKRLLEKLLSGENIALVSDAGTPAVSDPGEALVKLCVEAGIRVEPVPGAAAFVCALVASGLDAGRFSFEGFLSVNRKNRKNHLESLKNHPYTMLFYEAPHKLKTTLADLYKTLGDRKITIAREMTKKFEEFIYTTLKEAQSLYETAPPRGEFALVVEGKKGNDEKNVKNPNQALDVGALVAIYLEEGLEKKEAMRRAAKERNLSRREVYTILLSEGNE
jgi:16S rRNA (cytidine1402-2'-O)-methyltransferase